MSTQIIESYLPWDRVPDEERRFWRITGIMLGIPVVLSLTISHIKLPELTREQRDAQAAESRIVKLALTHKVELPKAVQKELEQEKKAEAQKKEEAKPEAKPEQKVAEEVAPKPEATPAPVAVENKAASKIDVQKAAARERAAQVMQEQGFSALAGLADEAVGSEAAATPGMGGAGGGNLIKGGAEAAGTSRSMITSRAGSGSGGLTAAGFGGAASSGFGGGVPGGKNAKATAEAAGLAQGAAANKLAKVNSNIADAAASGTAPKVGKDGKVRRSEDSIRQTFQRFAGALNGLYQRALRDNPALQGTVTLKLSVAPDGSVTACDIIASELNDPALEAKIVARVKAFNFGADSVEAWDGKYTLNFFEGG